MVVNFTGFLVDGNGRRWIEIRVSGPHYNDSGGDYFFELTAPEIVGRAERIFGVDEDQGRSLAAKYLSAKLDGRLLLDRDGSPIEVLDLIPT